MATFRLASWLAGNCSEGPFWYPIHPFETQYDFLSNTYPGSATLWKSPLIHCLQGIGTPFSHKVNSAFQRLRRSPFWSFGFTTASTHDLSPGPPICSTVAFQRKSGASVAFDSTISRSHLSSLSRQTANCAF